MSDVWWGVQQTRKRDAGTNRCCSQVYWCPTSGDWECAEHGGFDICCNWPDRHRPRLRQGNAVSDQADLQHAWDQGYAAAEADALNAPYSDMPEAASWMPTPNPYRHEETK